MNGAEKSSMVVQDVGGPIIAESPGRTSLRRCVRQLRSNRCNPCKTSACRTPGTASLTWTSKGRCISIVSDVIHPSCRSSSLSVQLLPPRCIIACDNEPQDNARLFLSFLLPHPFRSLPPVPMAIIDIPIAQTIMQTKRICPENSRKTFRKDRPSIP
jgi:hypothetical protein